MISQESAMQGYFRPGPSGIRFNEYVFSEPVRLARWAPPKTAGLFAVMLPDGNWAPRPFQILTFGEFGNAARQVASQQEYQSWFRVAADKDLYVSVLQMPFSSTSERKTLCAELVRAYNPICQLDPHLSGPADLISRLEELQKRNEEQTSQLGMLLDTVGRFMETKPAPSRRRIGFLPESKPETSERNHCSL